VCHHDVIRLAEHHIFRFQSTQNFVLHYAEYSVPGRYVRDFADSIIVQRRAYCAANVFAVVSLPERTMHDFAAASSDLAVLGCDDAH
jgi:hypothetical protein